RASRNQTAIVDGGAYAIEWTTPSSPSGCARTRSGSAASCSELVTSSSITGGGSGSRLAIRCTSDSRPYPVRTIRAPCSCASRATANAIDWSVSTPVMSSRLPASIVSPFVCRWSRPRWAGRWSRVASRRPPHGSVPHAEAAVDRDHRPGDVRRGVAGQPADHLGDLFRVREPAGRDGLAVLLLPLLRQRGGHLGPDESGRDHVGGDVTAPQLPGDGA